MKLMIFVLNKIEKLDPLMERFAQDGICGATILDSKGMVQELYGYAHEHDEEEISFLSSLRAFLDPGAHRGNKTILTVFREEQFDTLLRAIEEVVGDLSEPDSGILFTLPLDFVRGKGLHCS